MSVRKRAVLNPQLLLSNGLRFSIWRMKIHAWKTIRAKLSKAGLDVCTLFGPYDLICKHYGTETFDIRDLMRERNMPEPFFSDVNEFRVQRIDKIQGVEMTWDQQKNLHISGADFQNVDALQKDWNAIASADREQLVNRGIILSAPDQQGEDEVSPSAFVFIRLLGVDTDEDLQLSRQYLQSALFAKWESNIRGLFWGYPHAHYQCVVELTATDLAALVNFVMEAVPKSFPKGVETATHLVIEHLAEGDTQLSKLPAHLSVENEGVAALDAILAEKTEGPRVEFKSSLRWDHRENRVNKELVRVVVKEISAFMNTEGGMVLIGVDDHGAVVGIERDLESLSKKDRDGFRLALAQGIENDLGVEFVRNISVDFAPREGREICVVDVRKGHRAAFIKGKTGSDKEFYIRADNASRPLDMEAAMNYIRMQWPG